MPGIQLHHAMRLYSAAEVLAKAHAEVLENLIVHWTRFIRLEDTWRNCKLEVDSTDVVSSRVIRAESAQLVRNLPVLNAVRRPVALLPNSDEECPTMV